MAARNATALARRRRELARAVQEGKSPLGGEIQKVVTKRLEYEERTKEELIPEIQLRKHRLFRDNHKYRRKASDRAVEEYAKGVGSGSLRAILRMSDTEWERRMADAPKDNPWGFYH